MAIALLGLSARFLDVVFSAKKDKFMKRYESLQHCKQHENVMK